jgi:Flp pilus assembly protein TadG
MRGESGQTTVFIALFFGLVMLGFLAFALDVGYLFRAKRLAQSAADAAAMAAAEEVIGGNSVTSPNTVNAANTAASLNGFDTATYPVQLSQSSAGMYSNTDSSAPSIWVTAVVSQPFPTFFLGAFSHGSMKTMDVSASAVAAGGSPSQTCICLLGPTGDDLNMSNDAQLNANKCGVESNSISSNAITVVGSASICGTTVSSPSPNWNNSSNINNAGTICPAAVRQQGAAPCNSGGIQTPPLPPGITCYANPINGWVLPGWTANYTLPMQNVHETNGHVENEIVTNNSVCYQSLNLSNASSVTFTSGYTYYIQGDFTTGGGAPVSGSGVSFVISGNINIANGVTLNLTAPTASDGNPGVLFYVPNSTSTVLLQGGSNSNFSGIIFAPNSPVTLNNGTGTNTKGDIVAKSLTMAGGATLNSYASVLLGGGAGGAGIAKLVQ